MTTPICAEHKCPPRECEGVQLTRARRVPVCMCDHPKTVHEYARAGRTDCGMCDCRSYEGARATGSRARAWLVNLATWGFIAGITVVFWGAVILGIGWPLAQAIVGH